MACRSPRSPIRNADKEVHYLIQFCRIETNPRTFLCVLITLKVKECAGHDTDDETRGKTSAYSSHPLRPLAEKTTLIRFLSTSSQHLTSSAVLLDGDTPPVSAAPSFWSRFTEAINVAEERLANFFGLNESKYQWALDEYMKQQLSGDGDATARTSIPQTAEVQSGMTPTDPQFMDRNSSEARS
ncbi:hypothetical protein R1flu_025759 [Riccia fluitans]|uniref:Uncharacterized protein n=1 Tax=Riccia fluitans TaxID=41844 RepID=A0ABD1XYV2_9MARC